ncbi:hypothetical protein O6R05_04735 [Peptoniphilus equinus]|uniref:Uncharacterized protein n=1 Tax=Peptoniphilus equinus TaxID=3016343 RepID=A0ABY7QTB3_9FIRM|nr:hypothetical protein [Peptoniphilus equinus]WBW49319.1 hypothetical protein O6R05_04735 [Peptoniphilus equinus]
MEEKVVDKRLGKYYKLIKRRDKIVQEAEEAWNKVLTDIGNEVVEFCTKENITTDEFFNIVKSRKDEQELQRMEADLEAHEEMPD